MTAGAKRTTASASKYASDARFTASREPPDQARFFSAS
jgi:hypothetical protein